MSLIVRQAGRLLLRCATNPGPFRLPLLILKHAYSAPGIGCQRAYWTRPHLLHCSPKVLVDEGPRLMGSVHGQEREDFS